MHAPSEDGAMRVCCLCGMSRPEESSHLCTAEVVSLLQKSDALA